MPNTKPASKTATRFEVVSPILRGENMEESLRFYVGVLGFENAPWGTDTFTYLSRDDAGFYLCAGDQGRGGAYVWMGVEDVQPLYEQLRDSGVVIRHPPLLYPWGLEMQIEDPDGNVLRICSAADEE